MVGSWVVARCGPSIDRRFGSDLGFNRLVVPSVRDPRSAWDLDFRRIRSTCHRLTVEIRSIGLCRVRVSDLDRRLEVDLGFRNRRRVMDRKLWERQGREGMRGSCLLSLALPPVLAFLLYRCGRLLIDRPSAISRSLEIALLSGHHVNRRSCLHLCSSDFVWRWNHHHRILLGLT